MAASVAGRKPGRNETFESQIKQDCLEYKSYLESKKETSLKLRLLDCKNEILLYWSESGKCLYSAAVTPSADEEGKTPKIKKVETSSPIKLALRKAVTQKLITSISPLFDVTTLKISTSGQQVVIFGPHGVGVIELPRRWGAQGQYEGGKKVIHCRLTLLDESFFTHHLTTKVLEVSWYHGMPNDSHLVVLTNDNCLRFYDVSLPEQPSLRFPLFDHPHCSMNAGSVNSFASVFGDLAVDFDISLACYDDQGSATHSIYIMQESGDVWVLKCKFAQHRLLVEQQGPLTMNPPSEDNYGCNYCSLVCLQTTPTIIAMATNNGTIHHCLVLESERDDDKLGDLSGSFGEINTEALYVYESVQLELNLVKQRNENDYDNSSETQEITNLKLIRDPVDINSYITVSKGGLHTVCLSWVNHLKTLATDMNLCDNQEPVEIETPAELYYLLCTQPTENSPSAAICGCTVLRLESLHSHSVICLMLTGELIVLDSNRASINTWSEEEPMNYKPVTNYHSPLRRLRGVGGFDRYVASILTKKANVPLIRCDEGDKLIQVDEYYKLLTKITEILREEYIQKLMLVKLEYEKRCKILRVKKEEQQDEMENLQGELLNSQLAERIAVKLENAQENMFSIVDRVCQVFINMQVTLPMSTEEAEWMKELKNLQQKFRKLRRALEAVKSKHENILLQEIPMAAKGSYMQRSAGISAPQAIKVRAVLKEQENSISKLVEDVEALQLRVGR